MRRRTFAVSTIILLTASVAACSSQGTNPAVTTTNVAVNRNAADAGQQIEQMRRRGDCLAVQSAYLQMKTQPVALASDPTPANLEKFRTDVADVRGRVPEGVRRDYDTVADAYGMLITQLDGLDLNDPAKVQANGTKAREALKVLDDADVQAADQRLLTYFKSCAASDQ